MDIDIQDNGIKPYLAVEEILPNALANPADPTVVTVVDALFTVIVPQLAHGTIVPSCTFPTFLAPLTSWLSATAKHAEHVSSFLAIQRMILDLVVAKPARVPPLTGKALEFHVSFVMTAT